MIFKRLHLVALLLSLTVFAAKAQTAAVDATANQHLKQLQQRFIDERFGMFIHFNIPTYMDADWPDPEASPSNFNPTKLNCDQWAKAAKSANMTYGCLTTKHHSGFCIWDTKSTDYNVMNSPLKRDVVKEYVDAFRKNNLKVWLYYSILDTHHKLRPNQIRPNHIEMVKQQITELLTNYGKIEALVIDGWDAPWSRISYDDISFEDIYHLVKKLQPDCLLMDLNGAKYPKLGLYYTDIKTYEMGAGQRMEAGSNTMPALACLPIQSSWFWKSNFPTTPVKTAASLVNDYLIKLNNDRCNFILNVAPNKDGLFDENAVAELKEIGKIWKNDGPLAALPDNDAPIISSNLAKGQAANSSWSDDMNISDFANDDSFNTSWQSSPTVKQPWYEISFKHETGLNTIVIAEPTRRSAGANINKYKLEYYAAGEWKPILDGDKTTAIKIHRFNRIYANKVRIQILGYNRAPSIAEFEVYNEQR
jgi:alpha-L-fucosidase